MERRLRITPDDVEDLGKVSTKPELELIDELFYRLAHGKATRDIATDQVAQLLRPQMLEARKESKRIARGWFSTGMMGDMAYDRVGDSEDVCFTADDVGRFYFTMRWVSDKPVFITRAEQPEGAFGDCPKRADGGHAPRD
jgi:hypothetical protein